MKDFFYIKHVFGFSFLAKFVYKRKFLKDFGEENDFVDNVTVCRTALATLSLFKIWRVQVPVFLGETNWFYHFY